MIFRFENDKDAEAIDGADNRHRADPLAPESFCTRKRLRKNLNSDDHFDRSFAPYRNESQPNNQKKRNNR